MLVNADGPSASGSHQTNQTSPVTLSGQLGTFDIVFTVLAYNAPLTVVTGMIGLLMSLGNGLGAPVAFVAAGALMIVFAIGFTTMAKHVPNAGAFYAYITAGLGRPIGFGSALMAMLAYACLMLGVYLYAGIVYFSLMQQLFTFTALHWWAYSVLLLIAVAFFGYLRITFSARILTVALICEVVLVFAWEISVVVAKGIESLSPWWLTPGVISSGSVGIAMLLAVTGFAGFEATAVFREEARDPDVTVPRATYGAILLLTLLFTSASYVLICAYGPELALKKASGDASSISLVAFGLFLGKPGMEAVSVLLCTSVFAGLLAMHNILARYIYCLGIDGTVPRSWAAVHERYGSPYRASMLVTMATLIVLLGTIKSGVPPYGGYGVLTGVGGFSLLLLLILTSMSVLIYFWRNVTAVGVWKTKIAPLVSFSLLSIVGWYATTNLDVLTGNAKAGRILLGLIFGTLVAGCIYALRLKRTDPEVYAAIGRQKL